VDVTFSRNPLHYFHEIPRMLLDDANTDGLLVYCLAPRHSIRRAVEAMGVAADRVDETIEQLLSQQCESLVGLARQFRKPLGGFSFQSREESPVKNLIDHGIPVFPSPERAAAAFSALINYHRMCCGAGRCL